MTRDNDLYVACIDLREKRCLVVGAGHVGLEKTQGLLAAHAQVTVVAPDAVAEIRRLAASDAIAWEPRRYRAEDLDGKVLVIAATSDPDVSARVRADADRRSMLVNVADVPELCNFILPAIVREGPIAVAVSTNGASPALAQRMKREADALFGKPYAELARLLEEVRPWAKAALPTYRERKAFFDAIVNGEPDPIELLRAGDVEAVRELIERARLASVG